MARLVQSAPVIGGRSLQEDRTEDQFWYDLFNRRCSRRDLLRVGGSAWALIALGTLPGRRGDWSRPFRSEPFTLGVGSGDPVREGVVLWTRLSGEAVQQVSGPDARIPVRW